jgi:hypothetical protein
VFREGFKTGPYGPMMCVAEAMHMNGAPKRIYLVAVVFFLTGLVCIAELLPIIFYPLGFERGKGLLFQPQYLWVLLCGFLLFCLLCYGVAGLVRSRPAARWAFLVMILFLVIRSLTANVG